MATSNGDSTRGSARAVLAILLVTVLWGWTFVWMKSAVLAGERVLGAQGLVATVGLFMTLRFAAAALVLGVVGPVRRRVDAGAWRGGFVIGALLLGGFLLQMFGLAGVSAPVSAFLTSLYVVFTALLTSVRTRRHPGAWLAAGTLLATFGAGFISGPPQLTFGRAEWLTVGCAFVFAIHILATDVVTKRYDPLAVTLTSFVWVALGSAVTLALGLGSIEPARLGELLAARDFVVPLALASLLATVLALSLMNLFQRELDPVRAAILYAIEPVWAALVAIGIGMSVPNRWLWVGGGALLLGNLLAELGPQWSRGRRSPTESPAA
jgi:drug/metabolite transporter (DMT)-like permease